MSTDRWWWASVCTSSRRAPPAAASAAITARVPPLADVDHALEHRPTLAQRARLDAVEIGLALPQYDFFAPGPSRAAAVGDPSRPAARRAEALGFDSVWLSDHLFLDRRRYGGPPAGAPALDPLPALGAPRPGAPTRVRLGTLTLCAPLRPATVPAKRWPPSTSSPAAGSPSASAPDGTSPSSRPPASPSRRPGDRLAHLEEAVQVIRGMFGGGPFTFDGRYERAGRGHAASPARYSSRRRRSGWGQGRPPARPGGPGGRRVEHGVGLDPAAYRERLRRAPRRLRPGGRDPATVTLSLGLYALAGEDEADLARRFERLQDHDARRRLDGASPRRVAPGPAGGHGRARSRAQLDGWAALGVASMIVSPRPFPFAVPLRRRPRRSGRGL